MSLQLDQEQQQCEQLQQHDLQDIGVEVEVMLPPISSLKVGREEEDVEDNVFKKNKNVWL